MKLLRTDNTQYLFPDGHIIDDSLYPPEDYNRKLSNMSDNFPSNYTLCNTTALNHLEVRTLNSECVALAGFNCGDKFAYVCDGVIHDGSDLITDGTFQNWTGGVPDDWTVETNAIVTEGTESIDIGGYSYTKFLRMDRPTGYSSDISIKQTITVSASTTHKLTMLNAKYAQFSRYSIYDNTNSAYIYEDRPISNAYKSSGWDLPHATAHKIFETPAGCTSITLSIYCEDSPDNYLKLYGVSLRPISQTVIAPSSKSRMYGDGSNFETVLFEYTKITGYHSVVIYSGTNDTQVKYGCVQSGILEEYGDFKQGLQQGLESASIVTPLKYGGRLLDSKYNKDIYGGSITLSKSDATEFMHLLVPEVRKTPRFWRLGNFSFPGPWTVFAKFKEIPVSSENNSVTDTINFELTEAL